MTNTCTSTAGLLPVVLFASAYVAADSVAAQSRGSDPFEPARRVLQERCVACHAAPEPEAGLALGSWGAVMSGSDYGEAVIPFDSENSLLVEMITKLVDGPHPGEQGAPILVDREIETLRTWIDKGARSPDGAIPFADATELLYVTNQGEATVSVIDMETNMVVRTVDLTALGFSEGSMPHHIAVEPDGSYWYVSLIVANSILKFDRHNNLVGQVAFDRPGLLALDPTGDLLFAARSMISANPPQGIGVINRSTMSLEEIGVFIPRPHALAADPMRGWVYTASLAVNQIVAVDPVQEEIELTMMGGERPHTFIGFAISPDGNLMVASTELTSKLFVFDLDRAPDMTPVDTIDLEGSPWHPVFTPDGRWVYVGNNWNNSVTVVDMDTRSVHSVVTGNGIAQPHGSATSPDGRFVYVSSRNLEMPPGHSKADHVYRPRHDFGDNYNIGTVVVIDTASQAIVRIIEVEDYASGLGRAPTYIGNRQ